MRIGVARTPVRRWPALPAATIWHVRSGARVCWDNAATESFWTTLKVEFYDRYLWTTKAAAKPAVGDWIERAYNRRRRHSAIGMITLASTAGGEDHAVVGEGGVRDAMGVNGFAELGQDDGAGDAAVRGHRQGQA